MNRMIIRKVTRMKKTATLALLVLACLAAAPSVARAGYQDGINLYQYVHGNPVNGIDPSGLLFVPGPGNERGEYAARCGDWAYNPETQYCRNGRVFSLPKGTKFAATPNPPEDSPGAPVQGTGGWHQNCQGAACGIGAWLEPN